MYATTVILYFRVEGTKIHCSSPEKLRTVINCIKQVLWSLPEIATRMKNTVSAIPQLYEATYELKSLDYLKSAQDMGIGFNSDALGLGDFLGKETKVLHLIAREDTLLTQIKVYGSFNEVKGTISVEKYTDAHHHTFLALDQLLELQQQFNVVDIFKSTSRIDNLLVIDCTSSHPISDTDKELFIGLFNNLSEGPKKILLVTQNSDDLGKFFEENCQQQLSRKYLQRETVAGIQLKELDSSSQNRLLGRTVVFQGQKMLLSKLMGVRDVHALSEEELDKLNELIDTNSLIQLAKNEAITIGTELLSFSDFESAYHKVFEKIEKERLKEAFKEKTPDLFAISGIKKEELSKLIPVPEEEIHSFEEHDPDKEKHIQFIILTGKDEEQNNQDFKRLCHDYSDSKRLIHFLEKREDGTIWWNCYYDASFYIQRNFNRQTVIKKSIKDILMKESPGEFVFSGINKEDLDKILEEIPEEKKALFEHSVSLEENSTRERFEELVKDPSKTIHWLRVKNEQLTWYRSHGTLSTLRTYIDQDKATTDQLDEKQFSELTNEVVVVADEPGMGKSTTLTRLSEVYRKKDASTWIIRIDLRDYKEQIGKLPDNKISMDDVVKFLSEIDEEGLQSPLAQKLLKHYLNQQDKLLLLFDGFDEIATYGKGKSTTQQKVINLLKFLKRDIQTKVWVTTRPYDVKELEDALSVFAYTFEPIPQEERKELLKQLWENSLKLKYSQKKLASFQDKTQTFAKALLKKASEVLRGTESKFMGIPLHPRLLATAFQEAFEEYCRSDSEQPSPPYFEGYNVLDLYQRFIDVKYDIYFREKTKLDTHLSLDLKNRLTKSLTKDHQRLAFKFLFAEVPQAFKLVFSGSIDSSFLKSKFPDTEKVRELNRVGIIQSSKDSIDFIHRTFAEYFSADLIADRLKEKLNNPNYAQKAKKRIWEFLLNHILIEDNTRVMRSFLDHQLVKNAELADLISDSTNRDIVRSFLLEKGAKRKKGAKRTQLYVATEEGFGEIANLLLKCLNKEEGTKEWISRQVDGKAPVHWAAQNGLEIVVSSLLDKGANVHVQTRLGLTPLHYAAREGYQEVVTTLLDNGADVNAEDIEKFTPLHLAARNGHLKAVEALLVKEALVNTANEQGWTPLHSAAYNGHAVVVEALLKYHADPSLKNSSGNTPLDLAKEKMDATMGEEETSNRYQEIISLLEADSQSRKRPAEDTESAEPKRPKLEEPQLGTPIQQVALHEAQQKAFLRLSSFLSNRFPNALAIPVKQGLYLPAFERRNLNINGKCAAITRAFSQTLFLGQEQGFLNNLKATTPIYERIAQNKQISPKEQQDTFALSQELDYFEHQLDQPQHSLPTQLIQHTSKQDIEALSHYINQQQGDFALHLVVDNHVIAIYRIGNNYSYCDTNVASASNLSTSTQLISLLSKAIKEGGYHVPTEGLLVEHFDVSKANKLLSTDQQQCLTTPIETEYTRLAKTDEAQGPLRFQGKNINRTLLYDLGLQVHYGTADATHGQLIHAAMDLNDKILAQYLQQNKLSLNASDTLNKLKDTIKQDLAPEATAIVQLIQANIHPEGGTTDREVIQQIKTKLPTTGETSLGQLRQLLPLSALERAMTSFNQVKRQLVEATVKAFTITQKIKTFYQSTEAKAAGITQEQVPLLEGIKKTGNNWLVPFLDSKQPEATPRVLTTQDDLFARTLAFVQEQVKLFKTTYSYRDGQFHALPTQDAEGIDGLNAAFTIQALLSWSRTSFTPEHAEGASNGFNKALQAYFYLNTAMIGQGALTDINRLAQTVSTLIIEGSELSNLSKSLAQLYQFSLSRFTSALGSAGLGLNAGLVGVDIYRLFTAPDAASYTQAAVSLGFDSANLALGGSAMVAGLLGAETTAAILGSLGVPLAGITIGGMALYQATAESSTKTDACGLFLNQLKQDLQMGYQLNKDSQVLMPPSCAVVTEIQLGDTSKIRFGSQRYTRYTHPLAGFSGLHKMQGNWGDFRSTLGLPETRVLPQGLQTLLLPYNCTTDYDFDYGFQIGSKSRSPKEWATGRELESKDEHFFFTHYSWAEFAMTRIRPIGLHNTPVEVHIDQGNWTCLFPWPLDRASDKEDVKHANLAQRALIAAHVRHIAYKLSSNQSKQNIVLPPNGFPLQLSLSSTASGNEAVWIIHAQSLGVIADPQWQNGHQKLKVGQHVISINALQPGQKLWIQYYKRDSNTEVLLEMSTTGSRMLNWEVVSKGSLNTQELQHRIQEHLKDQSFKQESYVLVKDFKEANYQGNAYYDVKNNLFLYTKGLSKQASDNAQLLLVDQNNAYFYNSVDSQLAYSVNQDPIFWVTDPVSKGIKLCHNPVLELTEHKTTDETKIKTQIFSSSGHLFLLEHYTFDGPKGQQQDTLSIYYRIISGNSPGLVVQKIQLPEQYYQLFRKQPVADSVTLMIRNLSKTLPLKLGVGHSKTPLTLAFNKPDKQHLPVLVDELILFQFNGSKEADLWCVRDQELFVVGQQIEGTAASLLWVTNNSKGEQIQYWARPTKDHLLDIRIATFRNKPYLETDVSKTDVQTDVLESGLPLCRAAWHSGNALYATSNKGVTYMLDTDQRKSLVGIATSSLEDLEKALQEALGQGD